MIYADSSFLVSLYLRDANSATARSEMLSNPQQIALSRIAALEVRNAFRLAVFRGWITPEQDKQLQTLFHSDSNGGFLQPVPFSSDDVFAEAERLSKAETAMLGNRSLDVLHIACARLTELNGFASFDERQRNLARKVGLQLIPAHYKSG